MITPATKMRKKMAKYYLERIFGVGAFEKKGSGDRAGPRGFRSIRFFR